MFPLRDDVPNVHKPVAVWVIMGINALIFLFELSLGPEERFALFQYFGVVPVRYFSHSLGSWTGSALADLFPFVTYMFLHASWLHFLLNMWVMWIFADNVEDVMGPFRFTIFYLLCGLAALVTHMFFNASSTTPVIGASGAIGGVMGAYLMLYPHGRVVTLIPIFFFPWIVDLPAVLFLGFWFVVELMTGVGTLASGQEAGIANWAHAGGFVAGLALIPLFRIKSRCHYCFDGGLKRYVDGEGKYHGSRSVGSGNHKFGD